MGHWHHSNDCSSRVPAQHSLTLPLSRGTCTDTTYYWLCSHQESLSHQQEDPPLSPHLHHLYFYAHFKLHYLTTGSDTDNPASLRPEDTAQSLLFLNFRHPHLLHKRHIPGKGDSSAGQCEGHELPEPPSTLVSQVLRLLQRTQRCCGDQSSKAATKPSREKN